MIFSVCALLYGDHPDLARRCLDSIKTKLDMRLVHDIRIGLNRVGPGTAKYLVDEFVWKGSPPIHVYQDADGRNVGKYPLMRKMFWDPERPLSDIVTWFDDDSYVFGDNLLDPIPDRLTLGTVQVGAVHTLTCGWRPGQANWIKAQPWYGDKIIPAKPRFCTGGWWAARTDFLRKWDYPFPALHHNNGDVLLGQLVYQQGVRFQNYRDWVAINADDAGKMNGAKRRGMSSKWPGEAGWVCPPDLHAFSTNVITFNPRPA